MQTTKEHFLAILYRLVNNMGSIHPACLSVKIQLGCIDAKVLNFIWCVIVLLFNSLQQQMIRKGRQIVITGSNLNLLEYFWQKYKRVCGSLTVYLIWLQIPSGAQSWQCELLTSQSLSHFKVKVWREWGQKPPDMPQSECSVQVPLEMFAWVLTLFQTEV